MLHILHTPLECTAFTEPRLCLCNLSGAGQGTITVPGCVSACPVEVPLEAEPQGGISLGGWEGGRGPGVQGQGTVVPYGSLLGGKDTSCHAFLHRRRGWDLELYSRHRDR
jgi:hypothetical protein